MRKKIAAFVLGLSILAVAPRLMAKEYTFDYAHSHIGFSVKHILTMVPGEFKQFEGTLVFDEKDPAKSSVKVTIPVDSINTNVDKRDAHLKSPDFFDAAKFPNLTFTSKKVEKAGAGKYKITGDLTIHGVTKSVVLDTEYLGTDEAFGAVTAGFTATTTIDRRDYGLSWGKTLASGNLVVGNDVKITLDIAANEKK